MCKGVEPKKMIFFIKKLKKFKFLSLFDAKISFAFPLRHRCGGNPEIFMLYGILRWIKLFKKVVNCQFLNHQNDFSIKKRHIKHRFKEFSTQITLRTSKSGTDSLRKGRNFNLQANQSSLRPAFLHHGSRPRPDRAQFRKPALLTEF